MRRVQRAHQSTLSSQLTFAVGALVAVSTFFTCAFLGKGIGLATLVAVLCSIVVAVGFNRLFHFLAGKHLTILVDLKFSNEQKLLELVDGDELPDNEIGDLMKLRMERIRDVESMGKKMLESHKLASLGQLAAGIGHEVNNPLAIIKNSSEMLGQILQDNDVDPSFYKRLLVMQNNSVERITEIIGALKIYARKPGKTVEVFSVNDVILTSLDMIHSVYATQGINITHSLSPGELEVVGNRGRLQQVVFNLINNARDVLNGQSGASIHIESCLRDEKVVFSVKDNGPGIPAEDKDRIFESFFTTKVVGQGTGLGLSICKNIIDELGGYIDVYDLDPGTEFRITLPQSTVKAMKKGQKVQELVGNLQMLQGHILLLGTDLRKLDQLNELLSECKLHGELATNLDSAIETMNKIRPRLIILSSLAADEVDLVKKLRDGGAPQKALFLVTSNQIDNRTAHSLGVHFLMSDPPNQKQFGLILHQIAASQAA